MKIGVDVGNRPLCIIKIFDFELLTSSLGLLSQNTFRLFRAFWRSLAESERSNRSSAYIMDFILVVGDSCTPLLSRVSGRSAR